MLTQLAPILRAQHGVITRAQCLDAGVSRGQIHRLLSLGSLEPMLQGVFRSAATPRTFDQRAMAAALAGGPTALVSHRMAIGVWGMRNYRCDLMEICAAREVDRPHLVARRYRTPPERRLVRGIPVTSPARSLLDCASVTSAIVVGRFLETWTSTGVVKLQQVEAIASAHPGHPGARVLTAALASRMMTSDDPDSPAESLLGPLLVRHGLPAPVLHHVVTVSTGVEFELDWSYPSAMVALEVDGYGVHLRSFAAFENDRLRRNELEIDGWHIMNFTRNLILNRPGRVVDQVQRMLESRI